MHNDTVIAFCINKAMFGAFRVALGSLLRRNRRWRVLVFHEDLDIRELEQFEKNEDMDNVEFIQSI